jgi:uncharacterized cupredoxin-like copper-binding protein
MAKLGITLKIYKSIDKELELLKSSGHYALLYTSFLSIFESIGSELHKENLKAILSEMIDQLWSNQLAYTDLNQLKVSSSPLAEMTFEQKQRKIQSSKSIETLKKFDYSLLSDFSYTKGPGTFSKQKRVTKVEISPGPGDYDINLNHTKARSPQVVAFRSKKHETSHSETPGPGSYNPLYHFRAR